MHNWSEKAKQAIRDKKSGKKPKGREPCNPEQEFLDALLDARDVLFAGQPDQRSHDQHEDGREAAEAKRSSEPKKKRATGRTTKANPKKSTRKPRSVKVRLLD
jgi:hypothetical protein